MGLYVASLSFVISSRNLLNTFQVHNPPVSKKFFFARSVGKVQRERWLILRQIFPEVDTDWRVPHPKKTARLRNHP
jgi:hypothetical protein